MFRDVYILRHSKYFSPTLAPVTATGAYSAPASLLHYFFPLILAGAEGAKTASYQNIQSDFIIVGPFSVDRNLRERLQLPCSLLNVRRLTMYLINTNSLSDFFRQESRVSKESFTSY